jgi:hypothetical protein
MADDHVLRIAHKCGNTADIGAGREGDQVRSIGSLPRRITAMTSGVSTKQIMSLTSNAERVPT